MKTFSTFLLATLFSASAMAYDESRLTITLSAINDVQVLIDNRTYRLDDNTIVLDGIKPGQHTVQVFKGNSNSRNYGSRNKNSRNDLLYSSTIYVKPNHDIDIMINRFGKALVDERDLRFSNDVNNSGYDRDNSYNRNRNADNNYQRAITEGEFEQLYRKVQGQFFGSAKMNTAKDALSRQYFATRQVRQLLQLFSSEADKLELAKLAYRNTVDQQLYYQLYDVFSTQRTKDELEQYIRNNRW